MIDIDGEPWFHAADTLSACGLVTTAGASFWIKGLADDEKRKENKTTLSLTKGWSNKAWLVSESGLYKIIMRSDKPEARAFQDWVTREVLPSIRKTGSYAASAVAEAKAAAGVEAWRAMDQVMKVYRRMSLR